MLCISRLMPWPSILMSDLDVFFSRSVIESKLDSSFFYHVAVIVHIDGVYLGLEEFYGL